MRKNGFEARRRAEMLANGARHDGAEGFPASPALVLVGGLRARRRHVSTQRCTHLRLESAAQVACFGRARRCRAQAQSAAR